MDAEDDRARWNSRYAAMATDTTGAYSPPTALLAVAGWLPPDGVAVDLAGGAGGAAFEMSRRGLLPVLVEVSDKAIELAEAAAARRSHALSTLRLDLTGASLTSVLEAVAALGLGQPVRAVTCFHFLDRVMLGSVVDGLPTDVVFASAIATTTNLERNERPSARFLLEPGELFELVVGRSDLEVLHRSEDWRPNGHHEAVVVVRRR